MARTLGAAARHESEHKGERQRRAARQAAERGTPPRSGTRGYGYERDKVTIVDDEAAVIREAARRVLAGEAVRAVAADLNERGIVTVTGKTWTTTNLTTVLTAARISGRREYIPVETYTGHTRPRTGEITAADAWPHIITPAQSDRLRALLTAPGRGGTNGHGARSYLLSGLLRCGLCGHPMYGRVHNGTPRYQCVKDPGRPNCGKVAVYAHRADDEAREKILTALAAPTGLLSALIRRHQADAATGDSEDVGAKLRQIDQRRDELAAAWAEGDISRKEWATAKHVLDAQAEQYTRRLSRSVHALALAEFAALDGDMWQRWHHPKMTDSARRALIQACVSAITVQPADGKRWNPDRIRPQWLI